MRLIVPMGGRGTRLRPLSHTTPEALLPLAGATVLERTLRSVRAAVPRPLTEVVFVLRPTDRRGDVPDRLGAVCAREGVEAAFAVQDEPLGTAHAVVCAEDKLDGEVVTVWPGTLFSGAGAVDLDAPEPADLVAWTAEVDAPGRAGAAIRDDEGRLVRLVEAPPALAAHEALVGVYYVRDGARLYDTIRAMIARGATGADGEYHLTDALDALVQTGARVRTAPVDAWLDAGTLDAYLATTRAVLDVEGRVEGGVEDGVVIEPSYVGPGAVVRRSVVGPHAAIEAGAVVEDAVVRRSVVLAGAHVADAVLDGALIGERARVAGRPAASVLGDDAQA